MNKYEMDLDFVGWRSSEGLMFRRRWAPSTFGKVRRKCARQWMNRQKAAVSLAYFSTFLYIFLLV